jgi:hypothetical protein
LKPLNDYDEVDIKNNVVYEVEEESESSDEDDEDDDTDMGICQLEIDLKDGSIGRLIIYQESTWETDIVAFCEEHGLDDLKRKKLQKIVKTELFGDKSDVGSEIFDSQFMKDMKDLE